MMDRNDIARLADEIFDSFVANPPEDRGDYSIRMTSGTTSGTPFLTIWQTVFGAEWRSATMRRFLLAFGPRAMRTGNVLFFRRRNDNDGALILPLDGGSLSPELERLLDDFAPDSVYAFPSFMARVSEYMSRAVRGVVHTLGFSGESVSRTLGALFTERFPKARQIITFGTAETGVITAFPCDYLGMNRYHPRRGVDIGVFEPDADGIGYLLISRDLAFGKRMEQYKIGDMARIVDDVCPCGNPITFEVFGRGGFDFFKVAGAILRRDEFDRAASACSSLIADYRALAEEVLEDGVLKGNIELSVYPASATVTAEDVSEAFAASVFLTRSQTLKQLIDKGLFKPLVVTIQKEPFEFSAKANKLQLKKI